MVVLVLTFVSRHAAADYEAHGSNQPPTSLSPTRVTNEILTNGMRNYKHSGYQLPIVVVHYLCSGDVLDPNP